MNKKEIKYPLTLVIENEKEAIALWHRLNAANIHFKRYIEDRKDKEFHIRDMVMFEAYFLWKRFNQEFPLNDLEKNNV